MASTSTMAPSTNLPISSNPSFNSHQPPVSPPLSPTTSRIRTTSFLSSPMFNGRLSFSSSASSRDKGKEEESIFEFSDSLKRRQTTSSVNGKGKGKPLTKTDDRSKPPKSKSANTRFSSPVPILPSNSFEQLPFKPKMESRWSEDSTMAGYARKGQLLSKSTPDLTEFGTFQPWPTLDGKEVVKEEKSVDTSKRRRSRVLSTSNVAKYAHKVSKSLSSILLLPNSPKSSTFNSRSPTSSTTFPHSSTLSTDEYLSQSIVNRSSRIYTPPPPPFSSPVPSALNPSSEGFSRHIRVPSPSPSPTTESKLAARAEALAKLTEPPPLISTKREVSPTPLKLSNRPLLDAIDTTSSFGTEEIGSSPGGEGVRNSRWSEDTSLSGAATTPSRLSTSSIMSAYHRHSKSNGSSPRNSGPLPPRPKKAYARTKSLQQRAAVLSALEDELVKQEVKKCRAFLEGEFGIGIWETKRVGMERYEREEEVEEENLWSVLKNGVLLCRLLNQLVLHSPPILSSQIDRRGGDSATTSNLDLFLDAASSFYNIASENLFTSFDLQLHQRVGLRKVMHTLSVIEIHRNRTAATTTTIPTSPLRGRVLRAKSVGAPRVYFKPESPGADYSDSTPPRLTHSPDSSSYNTDSPHSSVKKSFESITRPSIHFSGLIKEREGVQGFKKNSIYSGGDRRMTESAIDVSILEEVVEEGSIKSTFRYSQPIISIDTKNIPQVRRSNSKRYPVDASMKIESLDGLPIPRVRSRNSSEISKPTRLTLKRSMSNITTASEALERQELTPLEARKDFTENRRSTSSSRQKGIQIPPSPSYVPFPSTPSAHSTPPETPRTPKSSRTFLTPESPAKPLHKRWNSELFVDHSNREVEEGSNFRSRHESLANEERKEAMGGKEGMSKITRTKLVLREDNKPTITYQLGECIGKGQFGSVYRALNLNSGRVSAVKRIGLEGKSEEEVLQLSNEVHLLRSLVHPAVVQYEGLVRTDHYLNIILEYVENGSLQKTIKAFGELPEGLVASYVVKILEGLSYLHQSQVVHCDLKAANILSTKQGNIKLSDFGVSLNLNAVQSITKKDAFEATGTPYWMAPEVIQLQGASTASDIYSLGCTIVELITGKPPYSELLPMSAMFRIVEDDQPPIPPKCSPELVDFLELCFAKNPKNRPSADELFGHVWLQKNWDPQKDLRPQDSIPFLRRISTEIRRPEFDVYASPLSERFGPSSSSPIDSPINSSSAPNNFGYLNSIGSSENIHGYRTSFDSPRLGASLMKDGPTFLQLSPTPEPAHTPHAFVKTTFSKAVNCMLCREATKKHAVLCSTCGIIAHSRCEQYAPSTCDLRSQLLSYSNVTEMKQAPTLNPTHSALSPLASPNGSSFNLAVILPFSKRKPRPSPPPPSSSSSSTPRQFTSSPTSSPRMAPQDLTFLPPLPNTPPLRPSLSPTNHSSRKLSPGTTPTTSLRSNTTPVNNSVGSHTSLQRVQLELERETSTSPNNSPLQDHRRGVISFSEGGGINVHQSSSGTNKLAKRNSHGRSQSGGINKTKKEDCCIM